MSNQQNWHPGQSPYGQQPQQPSYGPPQYGQPYGGYPPPPPPPPPPRGPSKIGVVLVSVVGALVLIGTGAFMVSRFNGGDEPTDPAVAEPAATKPAATKPTDDAPTQPSATPTSAGSPSSRPSSPAKPSARALCNGCMPGVTVNGLVKALKSKGFACKEDKIGLRCKKGKLEVGILRDYREKNYIENVDVGGRAGGMGDYPQGPREAFAALKAGLPGVLPLFIPSGSVRQQVVRFTSQHAGQVDRGPSTAKFAKVSGYRLSIHGVGGARVGKNGRYASSYSTSVTIYGPSAY